MSMKPIVMTADLDGDLRIDPDVVIGTEPTPAWSAGFATANGISPPMRGVHDRMLASILMPAGYATVVEDGKPVAYGLAVVERGMVGLFDIVTMPEARRRGAGRLLVKSLLAWGRSQGATAGYLQVLGTQRSGTGALRQLRLLRSVPVSLPRAGLMVRLSVLPLLLRQGHRQVRTGSGLTGSGDVRYRIFDLA